MRSIGELAQRSGVSVRTLRWYDHVGLLHPAQVTASGARLYDETACERLAQILVCRGLDMSLAQIGDYLAAPEQTQAALLQAHLTTLTAARTRLDNQIDSVQETLRHMKGEGTMTESERFERLKGEAQAENEKLYGAEAREKYGDAAVEAGNARFSQMSAADYQQAQEEQAAMFVALREALRARDAAGPAAQEVFRLHRSWLCRFWPEGMYTPAAHACLADGYVADERFSRYYEEQAGTGAAQMLRDIIHANCAAE